MLPRWSVPRARTLRTGWRVGAHKQTNAEACAAVAAAEKQSRGAEPTAADCSAFRRCGDAGGRNSTVERAQTRYNQTRYNETRYNQTRYTSNANTPGRLVVAIRLRNLWSSGNRSMNDAKSPRVSRATVRNVRATIVSLRSCDG